MHISGVKFTNSFAFAGSVLFTEAVDFAPLDCSPLPCDTSDPNNFASNYGQVYATPPTQFNINIPDSIRSGAPLPVIITLVDGFGTLVSDWTNTVATIESLADISGSLRTFYQHGQATFANLVLHGDENQSYNMTFSISGPKLFGNDVDSQSMSKSVQVQACEPGESFDTRVRECACAAGYGLIKTDNTCRACAADEVVPDGSLSCTACPVLSIPVSPTTCECIPGYFGAITGALRQPAPQPDLADALSRPQVHLACARCALKIRTAAPTTRPSSAFPAQVRCRCCHRAALLAASPRADTLARGRRNEPHFPPRSGVEGGVLVQC